MSAIARHVGRAKSTVSAWRRQWGVSGALEPARRGPAARLLAKSARELAAALLRPPGTEGFDLERWSLAAIALWIRRRTGIAYHRRHVGRLLRAHGWTVPPVGVHAHAACYAVAGRDPAGAEVVVWFRPEKTSPGS